MNREIPLEAGDLAIASPGSPVCKLLQSGLVFASVALVLDYAGRASAGSA